MTDASVHRQTALNRATWSSASAQRDLESVRTFTDPGEQAAIDYVRAKMRGEPILDVGVGTGRTVPLLTPLTTDYRALDYSPAMVETCRRKFPGLTVDVGDARDLGAYPTGHFGLVSFAFCGIDAVPADDRRLVFRAVKRVLKAGGMFFFSALNIQGPSYRERPWRFRVWPTRNPARIAWSLLRQLATAPLDLRNWLRIRGLGETGEGYAVAPLSAHHYGVLAHYTTLARQLAELAEEGFEADVATFDSRGGRPISPGDDTSLVDWFHFVARSKGPLR